MTPFIYARAHRRGASTVEFALTAAIFFTLLFGVIEVGRLVYVWNTVQNITRQAARDATVADFTDTTALAQIRQNAIFRTNAGALVAAGEITDAAVNISYLNACMNTVDPSTTCPSQNITYCLADPNGKNCIRFVQARLCDPANANGCTPINYKPMVLSGFIPGFSGIPIPPSQALMPAESLGFRPSSPSCTAIVDVHC